MVGELVAVQLAGNYRARLPQTPDQARVHAGRFVSKNGRAGGRDGTCHVGQVLDPDRHAVQRTAILAGQNFAFGPAGVGQRLVVQDCRGRAQRTGVTVQPAQTVACDLDRADLADGDQHANLGQRKAGQFVTGHHQPPSLDATRPN